MKRSIIKIDEEKCTGCELCIPNCPEGAIQIIDGKARLVSDLCCDGLGACLGHCPEGAIEIEEREAEPYDESTVMENIIKQGDNVVMAHLEHLKEHGESEYLKQAVAVLEEKGISNPLEKAKGGVPGHHGMAPGGCPGSRSMKFDDAAAAGDETGTRPSALTHWPIQLHLMSPNAPQYQGKDVLLSADCVAFSLGDFHKDYLKDKTLAIACPKLDEGQDVYVEKIRALIDDAKINTLTVMIMEVPCCSGLLMLARKAAEEATRKVPLKSVVVGVQGSVLSEEWV
ncbi:MAG: 4Fe-4S binding protein [Lentisphaerae bacterium]|nr:4Fe-4S binding protein [Lentisphaerota bacterium]